MDAATVAATADWIGLLCIPFFLLLDLVVHHRDFAVTRGWRLRALIVGGVAFWLGLRFGGLWFGLFDGWSLLRGAGLGVAGGAAVGILVYELAHYAYHRAAHRFDWIWRGAHQMHHSTESLDAFGAYYSHPLDTFAFASLPVLVTFPLLGLRPEAAAIVFCFIGVNAMFQHANIRTPRWLGYFVQRPESHAHHHAAHGDNYADLPLWDIVFGTFRNPEEMAERTGFYHGASARVGEMLIGRDVSEPPEAGEAPVPTGLRPQAG